jgi:PsbN protein
METATILIIFVSTLLVGVTGYSVYSAFGPNAKSLTDPFEEHENLGGRSLLEGLPPVIQESTNESQS